MPTFNLNLDDDAYQAAIARAQADGKSIEQLMADFLTSYAGDAPETDTASVGGSQTTYTVQSGDTLASIARKLYNNVRKYPLIRQANNINAEGHLYVGQVLIIPDISDSPRPTRRPRPTQPTTSEPTTPTPTAPAPSEPAPEPTPEPISPVVPDVSTVDPCEPVSGASHKLLSINGAVTDRPAPRHADLNLSMRGYEPTNETRDLISIGGATDSNAPQLRGLFEDKRVPDFPTVYRVHDWDWGQGPDGAAGRLLSLYDVSLIGMRTELGEVISVPSAGYSIGEGMQVLVLYATIERVTIKYTREDNVIDGYTLHIEGICVEPTLRAAYDERDSTDRRQLVALAAGAPLGRATGDEIKVAIRDKGTFMDPRTSKDWWRSA